MNKKEKKMRKRGLRNVMLGKIIARGIARGAIPKPPCKIKIEWNSKEPTWV